MALAIFDFCGWETGDSTEASTVSGTTSVSVTNPRTGDYCMVTGAGSAGYHQFTPSSSAYRMMFGVGLRVDDNTPSSIDKFLDALNGSTVVFEVSIDTDGAIDLYNVADSTHYKSASGVVPDTGWHFCEVHFYVHASAGEFKVWFDSSEVISQTGKNTYTGSGIITSCRCQSGSTAHGFDDLYFGSCTASTDRLGNAEVFRYQNGLASATPDSGDALDSGQWAYAGETPTNANTATYTNVTRGGIAYTDDTASGYNYRHGPHGDTNIDGTIKAAKGVWILKRGTGSSTTHYVRLGNDVDGVQDTNVTLDTVNGTFKVIDTSGYVPTVDQHFAQGFGLNGAQNIYCQEMWAMLLHVPSAGPVVQWGEAALSASGTLTTVGKKIASASATLAASGALTAAPIRVRLAMATLSASGTMTTVALKQSFATVALSAQSSMTATALKQSWGKVEMAASGTLGTVGTITHWGKAELSASGTLTATAETGGLVKWGEASLSASGTLAVAAKSILSASAALSASGTLTSVGLKTSYGKSALSASGAITTVALKVSWGSAALAAGGTLSTTATALRFGQSVLSGEGTLTAAGLKTSYGKAELSASGTLVATAVGGNIYWGEVSLSASGSLVAVGHYVAGASAALSASGTLTTVGLRSRFASSALAASGTLTAVANKIAGGSASLSASGVLSIVSSAIKSATAALSASGSLTATALTYSAAVLLLEPVAYWRCGEASGDLADSSGHSNTAADYGTPTYGENGCLRGDPDDAVSLHNDSNDYFEAPNSSSLNTADVFSLIAWIKKASNGATMAIIARTTNGYYLYSSSSNTIHLAKAGIGSILTSSITITDTNWHMIAVTKNGATSAKLYIDKIDRTGSYVDRTVVATGGVVDIGRQPYVGYYNPWDGRLDEIAVFDKALTADEVADLYDVAPKFQILYGTATLSASGTLTVTATGGLTHLTLSEVLSLTDAKRFSQYRTLIDSLSLNDFISKGLLFFKSLTEAIGLSDVLSKKTLLILLETIKITGPGETATARPLSSADDVECRHYPPYGEDQHVFETTLNYDYWGMVEWYTAKNWVGCAIRFPSVQVSSDAEVDDAYLEFTSYTNIYLPDVRCRIYAFAEDNSAQVVDEVDLHSRPTTQKVDWDNITPWVKDYKYRTPSLISIIQEVVSRPGWVRGNALTIVIEDWEGRTELPSYGYNAFRAGYSYSGAPSEDFRPLLYVNFNPHTMWLKTYKTLTANIHLADAPVVLGRYFYKLLSEALTLTGSMSKLRVLVLNETLYLAHDYKQKTAKAFTEALSLADDLNRLNKKLLSEVLHLTDTRPMKTIKVFTESIHVTDILNRAMDRLLIIRAKFLTLLSIKPSFKGERSVSAEFKSNRDIEMWFESRE